MGTNKKSKIEFDDDDACGNDQNPPIFKLIDDCLMHVFSFLPIDDRIRIQRVCKHWQRVARLPWTDVKIFHTDKRNPLLDNSRPIKFTTPILKQVLKLCGSSITHFKDSDGSCKRFSCIELLKILKEFCPNICSIRLTHSSYNGYALRYLTEHFCELTDISIWGCRTTNEVLVANYFAKNQRLKSIELSGFGKSLTGACFSNLNKNVIESITITGCKKISFEKLEKVLPNLTKLHTFSVKDISKLTQNPDKVLKLLANKSNIQSLTIRDYNTTRNFLKEILKYYKCLQGFVNLTSLDLRGDRLVNDQVLKEIGKYCKKLKSVTLQDSERIEDEGLIHITQLPNLEYLELALLKKITDKVLINMPKLKTLKCSNCEKIESRGIISLLSSVEHLQYLELRECRKVNQRYLIEQAKKITDSRTNDVPLVIFVHKYIRIPFVLLYENILDETKTHEVTHFSRKLRVVEETTSSFLCSSSSSSSSDMSFDSEP